MAILKKTLFKKDLAKVNTLIFDKDPNSIYFKVTNLSDTLTGGKNSFLIQGSPYLVNGTEVKIEIIDALGNTIYYEPAKGNPEPYEGVAKPIAIHIYPDTAFGPCTITILGEVSDYLDTNGLVAPVPDKWKDSYNVKWQKTINVNPNLPNTTKIRFYKIPKVEITEEILPIYNRTPDIRTISGSVSGIAINPTDGDDFTNFNGLVNYQLRIQDNSAFSQSMEGISLSINGLSQSFTASIADVVTSKIANVNTPYFETSSINPNVKIVKNFQSGSFTSSFEIGSIVKDSNINSSFANIKITDLDTFTGDVHRVKVYGKSLNSLGDYQLLEDVQLESSDLFIKKEFSSSLNVRSGIFTEPIIKAYWKTGSLNTSVTWQVDDSLLTKSVKLLPAVDAYNTNGLFYFSTTQSISFTKDTEYQLDFTPLLSASLANNGVLDVYMTGSSFVETDINFRYGKKLLSLESKNAFRRYDKQQVNFVADKTGTGELLFLVKSGVWQLSDVSLSTASETSFSPNEVNLTVNVPNKINLEKFEFKFEFYDVNNNFVPIDLKKEYTFAGGNDIVAGKDIILNLSNTSFAFNADNITAFPEYINFNVETVAITGSLTFYSSAFDITGGLIPTNLSPYPGLLQKLDNNNYKLTSGSFSGSLSDYKVGTIIYTASADGINRYATVYRLNQGKVGNTGPGIVYRGEWSASVNYFATDLRRDVVLGFKPNGDPEYYIASINHFSVNGQRPSDDNNPGGGGNTWKNTWVTFSAQFDSVATDILFAQDVYANRTINIGSKGGTPLIALNSDYPTGKNPNIKISASRYGDNGIFMGYDSGSPKLSLRGGDNALLWNGASLVISGSILATNGKIAGWVIDQDSLRDENTKIVLNPVTPSVGIYKSNIKKLDIRQGELTNIDAAIGTKAISFPNISIDNATFSGENGSVNIYKSSPVSESFVVSATDPLSYTTTLKWSTAGAPSNFLSTNEFFEGNVVFIRGVGIKNSSDNIIQFLYDTPVTLDSKNQQKAFNVTNIQYNLTFPTADTYKVFTFYEISGYFYSNDLNYNASLTIDTIAFDIPDVDLSSNTELSEFTDEGIQVLKSSTKYFRVKREDTYETNNKVIARVGGTMLFDAENSTNNAIDVINGNINLRNGNIITTGGGSITFANLNVTADTKLGPTSPTTNGYAPQVYFTTKTISSVVRPHVYMYNIPFSNQYTGNNRNLLIKSSGANFGLVVADASSSKRYKKNIIEWNKNVLDSINNVKVTQFNYKDQKDSEKKFIGLIAEDLDQNNLKEFVEYNDIGEPDAINKNDFIFLLMKSIQELTDRVRDLENKIDNSKNFL